MFFILDIEYSYCYITIILIFFVLCSLYAAESDCTTAIKLNEKYIKAYHRRASARMELKRYNDALKDIEVVLKLEPSNKEAMCMFKQVQKIIEKKKV